MNALDFNFSLWKWRNVFVSTCVGSRASLLAEETNIHMLHLICSSAGVTWCLLWDAKRNCRPTSWETSDSGHWGSSRSLTGFIPWLSQKADGLIPNLGVWMRAMPQSSEPNRPVRLRQRLQNLFSCFHETRLDLYCTASDCHGSSSRPRGHWAHYWVSTQWTHKGGTAHTKDRFSPPDGVNTGRSVYAVFSYLEVGQEGFHFLHFQFVSHPDTSSAM